MKTYDNLQKEISGEPIDEGMTSSVARMSAIVLKKRVVGYGNRVEGSTDIGQKLDCLSKQISAVGGIALVACSLSGEGLLSKGAIFTSLFSSILLNQMRTLMHSLRSCVDLKY